MCLMTLLVFTERVLRDASVLLVEAIAVLSGVGGDVRRVGRGRDHAVAR